MPSLDTHSASRIIKLLYLGDPGSGKTGSLTSLVKAGYKLRIIDFDNLLGTLLTYVKRECPDKIKNVSFATFTDNVRADVTGRPVVQGLPNAFSRAMKCLTDWNVEGEALGKPESWGEDTIVVIDSLTRMALAAFRWSEAMNPAAKEPRTWYFSAQNMVRGALSLLHDESFKTNVIVIAHIDYDKNHLDLMKGFPKSIGGALNSEIAAYFNCILLAETSGIGATATRVIRTKPTGLVELKNSAILPDTLPLDTGLATFFKAARET